MLAYVVVSQVAVVVVFKLAQMAADNGENAAGPAIYNNAFLIFMMAHGIIAVSIITALMPRMAAAAAEQRHEDLVHQLSLGTRLATVVLVPATVAYVILGRPLAVTLFEWGQYGHEEARATGWVIAVAGLGLVPFAISQLQLFAFYSMPDTKTPALINVPVVALRIGVDLLLYVVLPATFVAAGLMAGNAISFVAATALGYLLLRRRVGPLGLSALLATVGRLGLAGVIAAVPTADRGDRVHSRLGRRQGGEPDPTRRGSVGSGRCIPRRRRCAADTRGQSGHRHAEISPGTLTVRLVSKVRSVTGWALDVAVRARHP